MPKYTQLKPNETKKCSQCKEVKGLSLFNKHKRCKDGKRYECKDCSKKIYFRDKEKIQKYQKEYYRKPENQEKLKNYRKEYRQRPKVIKRIKKYHKVYWQIPEVKERMKKNALYRLYGLTFTDLKNMQVKQEGKCLICKTTEKRIVIDHNHRTGKVRGLLCDNCNHGLGHFKDSISLLKNAINYLK